MWVHTERKSKVPVLPVYRLHFEIVQKHARIAIYSHLVGIFQNGPKGGGQSAKKGGRNLKGGLPCHNFPLNSITPVCLCLFSYSLKACWNRHFWASRGIKISKFPGCLASLRSSHKLKGKVSMSRCLQVTVQGSKKNYAALLRLSFIQFHFVSISNWSSSIGSSWSLYFMDEIKLITTRTAVDGLACRIGVW